MLPFADNTCIRNTVECTEEPYPDGTHLFIVVDGENKANMNEANPASKRMERRGESTVTYKQKDIEEEMGPHAGRGRLRIVE